ncbi:MAG: hypothetical protein J7K75_05620 [Desulfuromonas sp.]|nr:hypothetical protein [Desulfuromonas sp.]
MTKKLIVLIAMTAFIGGMSSAALAKSYKGEVTAVKGNTVTVQVSKKDAKKISVGDKVSMKVKKGAAPAAGSDALTGC